MAGSRTHSAGDDATARRGGAATSPRVALQDVPIAELKGVGLQAGAILRGRGIETVGDLLARPPRRYLDLRSADDWTPVRERREGSLVALEARVVDARPIGSPRRRGLALSLREPEGATTLRAVFFNAPPGFHERASVGRVVLVVGTLRAGPGGAAELVHPRLLVAGTELAPIEPVYSGVGALAAGTIARIVAAAVARANEWSDPVPAVVAARLGFASSAASLRAIHAPDPATSPAELRSLAHGESAAHRRLGFEELLTVHAALEQARRLGGAARAFATDPETVPTLQARLGFTLSEPQREAVDALLGDLAGERPMRRLLVGEVGSGKTAVAAAATLNVLRAGGSAAWLVPTTLVAEQHAVTLQKALGHDGGPIAVLLGSTPKRARESARRAIAAGMVRLVIGTHALLEEGALPPSLALAVIDEQHRFGVAQRLAMVAGRTPVPHLLVLSATPIPRTLALARYGDLDVVAMRGRPARLQDVTTRVVEPDDRAFVLHTIERALAAGEGTGRAFVVVPRIDADASSAVALEETDAWLAARFGRDRVAVVHGRLGVDDQREALAAFRKGSYPILLGTSVVEVGLDVPEANLMVVLGAEHFGVAQLHQLRGRVGRGGQKAACLLVPEVMTPTVRARLASLVECHDGFALAEQDLARRGAGEWFGRRQSGGDETLHFADPLRDADLVAEASAAARSLMDHDPSLRGHPALARAIERVFARGAAPVGEEAG